MPAIDLFSQEGKNVGTVDLPAALEGKVNKTLLWQAVRMYLANQRQGTHKTKDRGEVSGGGRKPWRQKHTGRARAGSIRSPLFKGGGVVHGPAPRDYSYQLPKTVRRKALLHSLMEKFGRQSLLAVESFDGLEAKTKVLAKVLKGVEVEQGALLVVDKHSPELYRISKNIPKVTVCVAGDLNCYDVLAASQVVFTSESVKQLEKLLS